jgi:uncharacterized ferritin-like protein (DUF455 family)
VPRIGDVLKPLGPRRARRRDDRDGHVERRPVAVEHSHLDPVQRDLDPQREALPATLGQQSFTPLARHARDIGRRSVRDRRDVRNSFLHPQGLLQRDGLSRPISWGNDLCRTSSASGRRPVETREHDDAARQERKAKQQEVTPGDVHDDSRSTLRMRSVPVAREARPVNRWHDCTAARGWASKCRRISLPVFVELDRATVALPAKRSEAARPALDSRSIPASIVRGGCAVLPPSTAAPFEPPVAGTVEAWCLAFVESTDPRAKFAPAPPPPLDDEASWEPASGALRIAAPGRPAHLQVVARAPAAPRPESIRIPVQRARLLLTFAHHELQAAELFAWAVLAFPEAPREFRAGLVRLALEELAHRRAYVAHAERLGASDGAVPVRDWFWQRVAGCASPEQFVALQGLGLEGANLEHAARYAAAFRAAGDEAGARVLDAVERDEIAHVAFATRWFARFSGAPLDYDRWRAALPAPLTPALFQGRPLNVASRRRAGLDEAFLARLVAEPDAGARRR